MKIVSEDPLSIDLCVFLPEKPGGIARKFAPGEPLPDHARGQILARAGVESDAEEVEETEETEATAPEPIIALTIDVAEANVTEIEEYLAANPTHAETVMEAEEIATEGNPRKGVANAVAEALES